MVVVWLLLQSAWLCGLASANVYTLSKSISSGEAIQKFTFDIPENSNAAGCLFTVKNEDISNVLMRVSKTDSNLTLDLKTLSQLYLDLNTTLLEETDFQRAIHGDSQLVNVFFSSLANNNRLYFTVYNLDPQGGRKDYSVQVRANSQRSWVCYYCPYGSTLLPGCQCSPCPAGTYGPSCGFKIQTMASEQDYSNFFYSSSIVHFRIEDPPFTINLRYRGSTDSPGVTLYVQFERRVGDLAGSLNVFYDAEGQPMKRTVTASQGVLTFSTGGRNLIIALESKPNTASQVVLSFEDFNRPSKAPLIAGLSVGLGSVLVVILVVCICLRRKRQSFRPQNTFVLEFEDLETYFPEVQGAFVLDILVKKCEGQSNAQQQCPVCLNPIERTSRLRVTYCRHIFHSECLSSWFLKNPNCPFCRNDCQTKAADLAQQQLLKQQGSRRMTSKALIKAILQDFPQPKPTQNEDNEEKEMPELSDYSIEEEQEWSSQAGVGPGGRRRRGPVRLPRLALHDQSLTQLQETRRQVQ